MAMHYRLFLLDLDDTLLDFRASERLSFERTLHGFGITQHADSLFADYQAVNRQLWQELEGGRVDKEFLKVERFRRVLGQHRIDIDPVAASHAYLEWLPQTVVLVKGARALCEALSAHGQIGIITNGIEQVQRRRIACSGLQDLIGFVATSEACGHAKPDERFFDYTTRMATAFVKRQTVIIGDRLEADVLGGNRFGIDSCWFNPHGASNESDALPTYEAARLDSIHGLLGGGTVAVVDDAAGQGTLSRPFGVR